MELLVVEEDQTARHVDDQPEIVDNLDLVKCLLATVLERIGKVSPRALAKCPNNNDDGERELFVLNQAIVDEDDGPEGEKPDVVLSSHHLVENHKAPNLRMHSSEWVIIEGKAAKHSKTPLWYECQHTNSRRVGLIEQLVDEIPVN